MDAGGVLLVMEADHLVLVVSSIHPFARLENTLDSLLVAIVNALMRKEKKKVVVERKMKKRGRKKKKR